MALTTQRRKELTEILFPKSDPATSATSITGERQRTLENILFQRQPVVKQPAVQVGTSELSKKQGFGDKLSEGLDKTIGKVLRGAGKGVISTLTGAAALGERGLEATLGRLPILPGGKPLVTKAEREAPTSAEQLVPVELRKPEGLAEKIGFGIEQVGEFLIPSTKAVKFSKGLKGIKGLALKSVIGGTEFGGITALQKGKIDKDVRNAAIVGIVFPIITKVFSKIAGTITNSITKKAPERLFQSALRQSGKDLKKEIVNRAPNLSQQLIKKGVRGGNNKLLSQSLVALNKIEKQIQTLAKSGKVLTKPVTGAKKSITPALIKNFREQAGLQAGQTAKKFQTIINKFSSKGVKNLAELEKKALKAVGGKTAPKSVQSAIRNWINSSEQVRFFGGIDLETGIKTIRSVPQVVKTKAIVKPLAIIKRRYQNVLGKEAITPIEQVEKVILGKGKTVTVAEALKLKRDIYKVLSRSAFNVDASLSQKAEVLRTVANSLNKEVGRVNPAIAELTKNQQMWIRTAQAVENNLAKGGLNIFGLTDSILATGGLATGRIAPLLAGVGKKTLGTTAIKTNVAVALDRIGQLLDKIPGIDGKISKSAVFEILRRQREEPEEER